MENFWCAARLMSRREAYATHCSRRRRVRDLSSTTARESAHPRPPGRVRPPLFPGYIFILSSCSGIAARWCPGVARSSWMAVGRRACPIASSMKSARRERGGLIELPKPPGLQRGDKSGSSRGPFQRSPRALRRHGRHDAWRSCYGSGRPAAHRASRLRRGGRVMTLPEAEFASSLPPWRSSSRSCDRFCRAGANILDAYAPFCDPGPGDVDRAIRAALVGLWVPPAIEPRTVGRWARNAPRYGSLSKGAVAEGSIKVASAAVDDNG